MTDTDDSPTVSRGDRPPVAGSRGRGAVDPQSVELLDLEPDYLDEFVLTTAAPGDATEWAVAMFERSVERSSRDLIFQTMLRMRVAPDGTAGTVAGWQKRSESPTHVLLAAAGPLVETRLLIRRTPEQVRLMTAMHYRRLPGRLVWAAISWKHRQLAPWVLGQAASTIDH